MIHATVTCDQSNSPFYKSIMSRCDISLIETLPECMKVVSEAVVELCSEMEMVTAKEGTSNFVMPHIQQAVYSQ